MKDRFSTTSQVELTRRDLLKSAAAVGGAAALAPLVGGMPAAQAADVVRGYGVTTAQLKDWSIMEKSIGIKMEFTGTDNSVGVFMRDVAGSQLGDKVDIFIFESGTEDILGPQGMYLVIDEKNPELTLWDRSPDEWKHSEVVMGKDGKQYGVPVIGNADSFGYFPAEIGANPDGTDDISWSMFFESDKTRGKVGLRPDLDLFARPGRPLPEDNRQGEDRGRRRHDRRRGEAGRRLPDRAQEGRAVPHAAQGLRGAGPAPHQQGDRHHQLLGAGDPRSQSEARRRARCAMPTRSRATSSGATAPTSPPRPRTAATSTTSTRC